MTSLHRPRHADVTKLKPRWAIFGSGKSYEFASNESPPIYKFSLLSAVLMTANILLSFNLDLMI